MKSVMLKLPLAMLCVGLLTSAHAEDLVKTASAKTQPRAASGTEERIRKMVEQAIGEGAVVGIRRAGYGDFYEVSTNDGSFVYVDAQASFLFTGQLIDLKNRRNVTQARETELSRINFSELPLSQAVKTVRGNGKRTLVTFEDPNCGYCKKLARDIVDLKDTTVYTFIIPILSPDSREKGRNIWCAPDKAKAWNDWMVDGKNLPTYSCDTPLDKNYQLSTRLRIRGTPTMFTVDGNRIGGYVSLPELDKAIADAEVRGKAAP